VDEAKAEAAGIITAAEAQAGEIQGAARQDAEQLRVQGARATDETRRLEDLRRRTHELGRMHGHLESVLEEIRLGIDDAHDVTRSRASPSRPSP
jgi:cell division septum initiation protein DivIVA